MKKIIFIIAIMTMFASCDEYLQYQANIDNQTNDTIKFFFKGRTAYLQGATEVMCLPHTNTIYMDYDARKGKNIPCDPRIDTDEVEIIISSERQLTKDIWNANNWVCNTTKKKHTMTFVITEDDLQ